MKLSVVIVNYKVQNLLLQCLDAVSKSMEHISGEVIVVDNNSEDDSQKLVQHYFPSVHFIANVENVGFSKANNQGILSARGEYVLLLNPDTIIGEQTLTCVCDFADNTNNFGALGVRMVNGIGCFLPESKRGIPTVWASFCKIMGLNRLFPSGNFFNGYYFPSLEETSCGEVPILAGAFMLLNKKELKEEILLDEQFFMYGEDIDLSYRITLSGLRNFYVPTSILHYKGESAKKGDGKHQKAFYQSMLIFYKKHFAKKAYIFNFFVPFAVYFYQFFGKRNKNRAPKLPEIVVSTDEMSYQEIISLVEEKKGVARVKIYHPKFDITI